MAKKEKEIERLKLDPRIGLLILVFANITGFTQNCIAVEFAWIGVLSLLIILCGRVRSGIKWAVTFILLYIFQWYVLPISPKIVATSFSIFCNYARRMFPCLMVGSLMVKTISLREFIVGLRKLHIPQKLIIPISVTIRYFPAIKEETGHIRDAMRLRNIKGMQKAEALIVPLMMSATETAEELSAAAVTRGIENPAKKTSVIELHIGALNWIFLLVSVLFAATAIIL